MRPTNNSSNKVSKGNNNSKFTNRGDKLKIDKLEKDLAELKRSKEEKAEKLTLEINGQKRKVDELEAQIKDYKSKISGLEAELKKREGKETDSETRIELEG